MDVTFYFYFITELRQHHIIHSGNQTKYNKEKVAGIPQQREPVTAGPEN